MTLTVKFPLPAFTAADASLIARQSYGLRATARPLPSERDRNFLLTTEAGEKFVLKIASAFDDPAVLDFQNRALERLALRLPALAVPRLRPASTGEPIARIAASGGATHLVRLLTYIPGKLLAEVAPHTPALLRSLGGVLGQIDAALADFDHPAAERELKWDLKRAGWIREYLGSIENGDWRAAVERALRIFDAEVAPALPSLRTSVIYNDANDYNVLVGPGDPWSRRVIGVIDFGDMLRSATVSELAVAAAYAMLGKPDPLAAAAHVVAGYHEAFPLAEPEIELLFPLVSIRLAVSVANAAYQRVAEPGNEYLTISEAAAGQTLERLASIHPRFAHYAFRHACGLPACPQTGAIVRWLGENAHALAPVVDPDPRVAPRLVFDLSVAGSEAADPAGWADPKSAGERLFRRMRDAGAAIGIGRYNEPRTVYNAPAFLLPGNDGPEWRTIHIGLDLFLEPGAPVFAPLDGVVHSFANNAAPLDYGPAIVLEHAVPAQGFSFFTLYGHLSLDSLAGLAPGLPVKRGVRIARIGDSSVNGGWPPHLHFQIIADMLGRAGDFPGVAPAAEREIWLDVSPNPNLIAKVPGADLPAPPAMTPGEILALRSLHVGKSLSVAYRRPLVVVRGSMQYLYDETGRRYLDGVNNVAHVGHCHPRVVRAGREQMAVLNTNTRYLHPALVRYAQRLVATLPEPLRICFFVCSGSEANELALRLARAYTGGRDVVVLDAAYHGNTTALVEISPYKFNGPGGSGAPPHVHVVPLPDAYRGPYRRSDPQAGPKYARHVREAMDAAAARGREIAAFIAESLPGCGGQIVLPHGYLVGAYRHARAAGAVCIADEVQTGFGRVGSHFWGFETQAVVPDIVTMGKPIGNGHPIGAVVTTPEIAAASANGMEYFNTFGGNPVSCAIGMAVLDVIAGERLQARALEVGARLAAGLRRLMEMHPVVGDVRGLGLFLGIELVLDRETLAPAPAQADYLVNRMRECGILLSTDGPFHNVIKIKPPLVFTAADADFLVATLDRILAEDFIVDSAPRPAATPPPALPPR
ncbi:MAG TPA: aminotransferase class III-fold pyridoxal phosphate-dependent enzyme [Candidatus Acidoferrales bacterium]|nr:aminotransferase class III-fold pyridoxal phosphate-dependent enzyme [Candidatus Acidoferrales bacterium]